MHFLNLRSKLLAQDTIVRMVIDGGILATFLIVIGSLLDTPVHIFREHSIWESAHLFIIASAFVYSMGGGFAFVALSRVEGEIKRCLFYVFLGGTTIFVALVIFDELWHIFFGLDENAWTPPHLMFWAGVLIELWGLLLLSRYVARGKTFRQSFLATQGRLLSITAGVVCILLFLIYEFDIPAAAGLADDIPGFAYPGAGTLVFVTGLMVIRIMIDRPFFLLAASTIGWFFFWLTGTTIEVIWGASFILMPFPIMVQALTIDLLFLGVLKGTRKQCLWRLILGMFIASVVSYWSMVGWASEVTKLPQQLQGGLFQWITWFWMLAPGLSLVPSLIVWRLEKCRHFLIFLLLDFLICVTI